MKSSCELTRSNNTIFRVHFYRRFEEFYWFSQTYPSPRILAHIWWKHTFTLLFFHSNSSYLASTECHSRLASDSPLPRGEQGGQSAVDQRRLRARHEPQPQRVRPICYDWERRRRYLLSTLLLLASKIKEKINKKGRNKSLN